ncbi:MAG: RluA family pseudouridine synthase [Syntrophomonadaceae bacterium]
MKKTRNGKPGKMKFADRQTRLPVTETAELMSFLIANLPRQSRNNIKSLLTRGQVSVDGHIVRQYNYSLQPGQEVAVDSSPVWGKEVAPGLKILYEDSHLLVVDKPAGLLTIASDSEKENTAYHHLMDYVREKKPDDRIFIVHRLDRDTSGVIVFAKQEEVKRRFQEKWKELVQERAYIAVVEGPVDRREDTVRSWLLETKTKHIYSSAKPGDGLEAVTHYKLLQASSQYSLLEIHLETGRKNQIRVHMQDIGHPVVGDKKYGSKTNPLRRLALHARVLAFNHPVTNQPMRFETEIPAQFMALLK